MKRVSVILVSAILSILPGKAETGLIPVMPVVSDGLPLSPTALKALGNKVTAMAVESGFGALSSPIVLTADVNIADKTVTDTAPPMVVTEVEVFFYVADVDAQVILAETSVTVKSVDKTENKAVASV